MPAAKPITPGSIYGRLVVLRDEGMNRVVCKCSCGNEHTVWRGSLRSGRTKSCGCLHDEAAAKSRLTHGHSRTGAWSLTYSCWAAMIQRCTNPKNSRWDDYGGRGITVCERWLKFENFLADMGEKPDRSMSIERVDNNGNYEPTNCVWIPLSEQTRNRRPYGERFSVGGRTLTISQWSDELGVSVMGLRNRLYRGWTVEQTFSLSPRRGRRPR